ncbi:MAG: PhoH family protein, partial [Clostridia bacterium]|nr:PhoH family protein [Clostridia bacterium]
QECGVTIALRGAELAITGEEKDTELAASVIEKLVEMIHRHELVDRTRIRYAIALAREGKVDMIDEILRSVVAITHRGKQIRCKTLGQQEYVQAIRDHDLTFAVGPAGTGKTYLAMALAVVALKNKEIERIVLTRPAVEAGEKLGFLPGDLTQKVDPYLRPLYDALYDFMGVDSYQKMVERGVVEVAPLAYMRGRTLSDSFIILDEAQNTTSEQMKMFLTRLGFNSKVVVTGDITQTDLPYGKRSGLAEAIEILKDIPAIGMMKLTHKDVVRHELVQQIVQAYDAYYGKEKEKDQ